MNLYTKAKKSKCYNWTKGWIRLAAILVGFNIATFQMTPTNPVTGQYDILAVREQYEIAYGNRYYARMTRGGGTFIEGGEISEYVQRVGNKIAKASDRPDLPYHFIVIDSRVPNAWALPGGKIAIHTGLLAILESEAELAAILSHEIIHAAARHRAQTWERATVKKFFNQVQLLTTPLASYLAFIDIDDRLTKYKHTRDSELEADYYGLQYMKKAGYNPHAATRVHEKLEKLHGNKKKSIHRKLFNTHPSSTLRKHLSKKQIGDLEEKGFEGRLKYRSVMHSLLIDLK